MSRQNDLIQELQMQIMQLNNRLNNYDGGYQQPQVSQQSVQTEGNRPSSQQYLRIPLPGENARNFQYDDQHQVWPQLPANFYAPPPPPPATGQPHAQNVHQPSRYNENYHGYQDMNYQGQRQGQVNQVAVREQEVPHQCNEATCNFKKERDELKVKLDKERSSTKYWKREALYYKRISKCVSERLEEQTDHYYNQNNDEYYDE